MRTQDLSLLTHISQDDIKHLQSVGKDAQAARKQFILKDDQVQVWKHVQSLRDARIDFVLDNGEMIVLRFPVTSNQSLSPAGFEVVCLFYPIHSLLMSSSYSLT